MLPLCTLRSAARGIVAVATLAIPAAAGADPVSLSVNTNTSLQQILNRPCVIGDPSCHNPDDFDYTLIGPHMNAATLSSPTYTVEQIRELVSGDTFAVGVDLNQARGHDDGAYDLLRFTMSVNGTIFFSTSSAQTLTPTNPGNGYSDASILGFDLSSLAPTDKIVFTTTFGRATAGREQYFLQRVSGPGSGDNGGGGAPVPEPASMILLGTGLAGALAARRRRNQING